MVHTCWAARRCRHLRDRIRELMILGGRDEERIEQGLQAAMQALPVARAVLEVDDPILPLILLSHVASRHLDAGRHE